MIWLAWHRLAYMPVHSYSALRPGTITIPKLREIPHPPPPAFRTACRSALRKDILLRYLYANVVVAPVGGVVVVALWLSITPAASPRTRVMQQAWGSCCSVCCVWILVFSTVWRFYSLAAYQCAAPPHQLRDCLKLCRQVLHCPGPQEQAKRRQLAVRLGQRDWSSSWSASHALWGAQRIRKRGQRSQGVARSRPNPSSRASGTLAFALPRSLFLTRARPRMGVAWCHVVIVAYGVRSNMCRQPHLSGYVCHGRQVLGNNNLAKKVGAVAPEPGDDMVILAARLRAFSG